MGFVQGIVTALMLSAQLVLTSPVTSGCTWCPPGEYRISCKVCAPCPAGQFTSEMNTEHSCHRCFGDCRPDYNLRVARNCSSTSNTVCVCKTGFTCTDKGEDDNCRFCEKNQETATSALTIVTSGKDKPTLVTDFSRYQTFSTKPCQFPKCQPTDPPTSNYTDTAKSQLAAILSPVVVVGCVALVILFCIRRPGDEMCFKKAIVKLYNEGGHEASHKSKESAHQFPRDSFSAKQQPESLSAANLGPVHVHNPGTVIFSLLSQFTGQVGPTVVGKMAEKVSSEEEDGRDCPVFHPTSSSSVHLSEEERSEEIDSIFFPSQEQGKDCHMSKEEEL
ncbi:tumor necrosis factor receptor superfamily member 14 [Anabas testudineus]|uniref:tumor necrosis factor receptor superfamily member 14 n=1 Tax=Anabas testudineus TaxID=64144 RepID=UPI000E454BC6|nr:tumor necrosis factor receptor superfamily member 14 [Anabas testudineus]